MLAIILRFRCDLARLTRAWLVPLHGLRRVAHMGCGRITSLACACLLGTSVRTRAQVPSHGVAPEHRQPPISVLSAQVFDDQSSAPLAAVHVSLMGTAIRVVTDAEGRFELTAERSADFVLSFKRLGYQPASSVVSLTLGDTTRLSFFLRPVALTLDAVNVAARGESRSARLAGFDRRRAHHINGDFITRAMIEQQHTSVTTNLVRIIPGVTVLDSSGTMLLASMRGGRPTDIRVFKDMRGRTQVVKGLDIAPCYLAIGIDGVLQEWGFSIDQISPLDIEGIEVYQGPASIPRELMASQSDGYCGVVMIWTRAGGR